VLRCPSRCGGTRRYIELAEQIGDVRFGGKGANEESFADLRIGSPGCNQP
jgi:hypothetical protein